MDKNIYIVQHSDLIGEISDFPIEVVQKMVERQYEQKGFCDVSVFQKDRVSEARGFSWINTIEGGIFWGYVVGKRDWDIFFDRYPKLQNNCVFVVVDGDGKSKTDVQKMLKYCPDNRRFANRNKVGDIYYIDVDRHGDKRVRFALANSALAKEVMSKGVEFGDTTKNVETTNKLYAEVKSEDASDFASAIRMLENAMSVPYSYCEPYRYASIYRWLRPILPY